MVVVSRCDVKFLFLGVTYHVIDPGQRHARCLEIALDHGADVNNVSAMGFPTLVSACETARYNEEICLLLLARGADATSIEPVRTIL